MALMPQKIPVKFGALDSKTDPRWVLPGDLVTAENVIFDNWPKIRKRNGYGLLTTAASGALLSAFKNQLLVGTGTRALGYSATGGLSDVGPLETVNVSARPLRRETNTITYPDIAVSGNLTLGVYNTSANGSGNALYSIFDNTTNQPIVSGVSVDQAANWCKPFVIGSYFVIVYYRPVVKQIFYRAIPIATPTVPNGPVQITTDLTTFYTTAPPFDATVVNGSVFLCYQNTGASNTISLRSLSSALVLGTEVIPTMPDVAQNAFTIFGDSSNRIWVGYLTPVSAPTLNSAVASTTGGSLSAGTTWYKISALNGAAETVVSNELSATVASGTTGSVALSWTAVPGATGYRVYATTLGSGQEVGYYLPGNVTSFTNTGATLLTSTGPIGNPANSTFLSVKAFVYDFALGALQLTFTMVDATAGYVIAINGTVTSGTTATLMYTVQGWASGGAGVADYNDQVKTASLTLAGVASNQSVLVRSVTLASKMFYYLGRIHFLANYSSALQSTYFMMSCTGGASPTSATVVAKLAPSMGGGTISPYIPEVVSLSAGVYVVVYIQVNPISTNSGLSAYSQTGAMMATLDWTQNPNAVELSDNLHVSGGIVSMFDGAQVCEHGFHLYPENVTLTAVGSGTISGTYQCIAVYEWMDAQGLIHQSAPSPAVSLTVSNISSFKESCSSLRLTSKSTPVTVVFYRTTANDTVFYRTGLTSQPVFNSTTTDTTSSVLGDATADTALVSNPRLYSNPNNTASEVPNIAAPAALHIWRYRNRLAFIPSENPFEWSFSKAYVPGIPVEFNQQQFYQAVAQDGGPLTCGIEMDDKNILFTASKIYFVTGDGPSPNGSGSDYSLSPQAIPTDVGCTNRRSLVLTPQGIMFQSAKGIYLLGRDLSVRYIGAPVESFNNLTITAAKLVPNSRRVIFYTNSAQALAWDYFAEKWAIFTNLNAVDATVFGGLTTYIQAGGAVYQETPGVFNEAQAILIKLVTSWLSFAGLSGFQRVWRFSIKGDYKSAHTLTVQVANDDVATPLQTSTVVAATTLNPIYEFVVKVLRQKSSSMQITIQESQPGGAPFGEGFSLSGITFLVGTTGKGLHPVGSTRAV